MDHIPSPAAGPAAPPDTGAGLLEQHRQFEAQLRMSEERLRMAVEAGEVGIWDWDIPANHVTWSDRVYEMHQMAPGSDIGGLEGFRSRVHPEDLERVEAALAAALAGGPAYEAEFRIRMPDGGVRWITTRGQLVRDAEGRPLRMVGASTDITARMELLAAEQRARGTAEAARRRFELLASAGAGLARSLDPQETLQAIAMAIVPAIADWCRLDLLDEQGVLQRGLAYHSDPARAARALEMARNLRGATGTVGSMAWVIATGQSHYGHYLSAAELADPALSLYTRTFGMNAHYVLPLVTRGRTIGAMAVLQAESGRDLHEDDRALILELGRRAALALDNARLFAEAGAARRQAEAANRAKDEFLAMLGHELRNPLAPIATALELMARREPHAAVQERRIIGRQVVHLSRLIDDLLDISRITQGKVRLARETVDLRAVATHALETTRPLFEQHAQGPQVRLPPHPVWVAGDPVRLAQVLCNLLVNAAKFTPQEGRVALVLEAAQEDAVLRVEDSGCGIAPELLPHVFGLFVQGRQDIDRRAGGLGLGLAIVHSLVGLHGGTVEAASAGTGQGSCFTVRLPAVPAPAGQAAAAQQTAPPQAPGTARILVVDDNADAAETLADLLQMSGYEVRTAGDARAALEVLQVFRPTVALLDIGLPDIDGYALAGKVRALPEQSGIRLVALTGYGRDHDRAQALAASFDEHLVKPVAVDQLLQVLERLLGPR